MSSELQDALKILRDVGGVEELRGLAEDGFAPQARPRVNSHIHLPPNFSAFESVSQAVGLADEQDVRVVGVTNYYDYNVYGQFVALAAEKGIFPLFGLEVISLVDDLVTAGVKVNDPGNPGRMYLCGKGVVGVADPSPRAAELLKKIRINDTKRMAEMTAKVARIFASAGIGENVSDSDVIDMIVARHGSQRETVTIQERHIAQFFQQLLFDKVPAESRLAKLAEIFGAESKASGDDAVKIQGEIRSHLMKAGKAAFVTETFLNFEDARELILELHGVPCYPTLADGTSPLCDFENLPEKLVGELKARKINMAELIPIRNTPEILSQYVKALRAAGIVVVGGTEHNTLDLLDIEPTCIKGLPVPDDIKEIFFEGICVSAAHQFLVLNGLVGFVDKQGQPNPDFDSDEARIQAFANLGAAVIQKFFTLHPKR